MAHSGSISGTTIAAARNGVPRAAEPAANGVNGWRLRIQERAVPLRLLPSFSIGSDARNELQISHGSIRPFHVEFRRLGQQLTLRALGDASLWVDERQVGQATLNGGERVKIGKIDFVVEQEPAVAPSEPGVGKRFVRGLVDEALTLGFYVVSGALHLGGWWLLAHLWSGAPSAADLPDFVFSASMSGSDAAPDLAEPDAPALDRSATAPEPESPLADALRESEPVDDLATETLLDEEAPRTVLPTDGLALRDVLGVGPGASRNAPGIGSGGRGGLGRGVSLRRLSGPLRAALDDQRGKGLDLVVLFDTTSSMQPYLDASRRAVDRIITRLAQLNPNLRMSIIAYRDRGDEYVTRVSPLSTDRYAILNFLDSLSAGGGGDIPEGLLDAVETALDDLDWRANSYRILLVVSDAPPHADDVSRLRLRIRSATGQKRGGAPTIFSTLLAGSSHLDDGGRRGDACDALRDVAHLGGGEFTELSDPDEVEQKFIAMTFGSRNKAQIEQLLERSAQRPEERIIAQRIRSEGLEFLFDRMRRPPIEASVVAALLERGSSAVARRCLDLVIDETAARPTREAALYVLRRLLDVRGMIDLARPVSEQDHAVDRLRRAIAEVYR